MIFWIIVIALLGLGLCAVLIPLTKLNEVSGNSADYDREVYKAQLAELDRDVLSGALSESEAQASRTEIARRLLIADRSSNEIEMQKRPTQSGRAIIIATAILIPAVALGFYGLHGRPELPGQPFASRELAPQQTAQPGNIGTMVQRLSRQLEANPENLEGWILLARSLLALGQHQKALPAFEKALGLDAGNIQLRSSYGEALFLAAGQVVTPAARAAFQAVLEKTPKEPRARYYLALADSQAGKFKEAHAAFKSIVADAPAGAPYLPTIIAQTNRMAEKIGAPVLPPSFTKTTPALTPETAQNQQSANTRPAPSRGPTAEDMRAAAKMSSSDRNQMIEGMVKRLADRLIDQPNDLKGWMRLANAYRVLGKPAKQMKALEKAKELAPKNIEILLLYGRTLRAAAGNRQTSKSIAAMRRVLDLDPTNLEALVLVGRAEVNQGQINAGKTLMKKALDQLPPGTAERKKIQNEINSLSKQ
ncbi:MAG: c-type cytochrome biogenesis protein CcmI [Rhodospirillaceae bacterium]|nr:c-type cytochrome biogenesis protein CcmI [Rhodospirillaceae bacterium]